MPQAQPNTGFNSQPLDIGEILRQLTSQAQDSSSASNSLGPATLSQLGNVGASTADATGPYQQGVAKALKSLGEQHVQEAHASGMSPEQIQSHPAAMSLTNGGFGDVNGNNITPQHIELISSLLNSAKNNTNDQSNNIDNNTQGTTLTPIQQQALNIIKPSTGFFGKLMENLGNAAIIRQGQLSNLQTAQQITGGTPEQQVFKAQAAELNQKIAGAEPIQPKDIADLNRQTYSSTITAANDAWQRNNDEIAKMQEQYKTLQEGRSGFSKGVGGQTKQMKALQNVIVEKMKQNQQHMSNLQTLMTNPPKAIDTQQQNSPFQIGQQYNGETIKNVRRIK